VSPTRPAGGRNLTGKRLKSRRLLMRGGGLGGGGTGSGLLRPPDGGPEGGGPRLGSPPSPGGGVPRGLLVGRGRPRAGVAAAEALPQAEHGVLIPVGVGGSHDFPRSRSTT